jgi:hypothetical protein
MLWRTFVYSVPHWFVTHASRNASCNLLTPGYNIAELCFVPRFLLGIAEWRGDVPCEKARDKQDRAPRIVSGGLGRGALCVILRGTSPRKIGDEYRTARIHRWHACGVSGTAHEQFPLQRAQSPFRGVCGGNRFAKHRHEIRVGL